MSTKLSIATIITLTVSALTGSLWLFENIAWASDIDRIEVRLIKRDLRDLRRELENEHDPEDRYRLEQYIQELLDDLCRIDPGDRECQ